MSPQLPPRGEADKRIGAYNAPLSVAAQDIPNMSVRIRAGSYFNTQSQFIEYSGGNSPLIVAPVSNAKWVIVALTDAGSVVILDGVASTSPTFPQVPAGHLPLAAVFIASTTLSILPTQVVDIRPFLKSQDTIPNINAALADRPTITDVTNLLALKADTVGTPENVFTLNNDVVTGVPTQNSSFAVARGSLATVSIRWNESSEVWELTNDGSTYAAISSGVVSSVMSVNGDTGNVILNAADVGAAPTVHTHIAANITDFTSAVSSVVLSSTIAQAQVTNLVTDLSNKAPLVHTHVASSITDFSTAADARIAVATIAQSQVTGLTTSLAGKAPLVHTHVAADITDFSAAADARIAAASIDSLADVSTAGATVGSVLKYTGTTFVPTTTSFRENTTVTTDATPFDLLAIAVAVNTVRVVNVLVSGIEVTTGISYSARMFAGIRNINGTTSLITPIQVDVAEDPGAAAWSADVIADDTADTAVIRVTGEAGKTINWAASATAL